MSKDEEGTLNAFNAHVSKVVEPSVNKHRGIIVKRMGDGLLVKFRSAVDAVRCAVQIQQGMRNRNVSVPNDKKMQFRIGLHSGDIIIQDDDIFGDGVNLAARIEKIAKEGGIAISPSVRDQIGERISLEFEDLGERRFKNIAGSTRIHAIKLLGQSTAVAGDNRPVLGDKIPLSEAVPNLVPIQVPLEEIRLGDLSGTPPHDMGVDFVRPTKVRLQRSFEIGVVPVTFTQWDHLADQVFSSQSLQKRIEMELLALDFPYRSIEQVFPGTLEQAKPGREHVAEFGRGGSEVPLGPATFHGSTIITWASA
jgi:hypothetical protein